MAPQAWTLLDTGISSAETNMAMDADLLNDMAKGPSSPILHLYGWETMSATYGHFIDPYRFVDKQAISRFGVQLAKRPTGGGVIFHNRDLAFSLLVPANHPGYSVNVLDNYAFVNRLVIEAIKRFRQDDAIPELLRAEPELQNGNSRHFCMAKPTKYDVMLGGRKVAGGAQRRTKHGFLHQGSISLALPDVDFFNRVLLPDQNLIRAMEENTYPLLSSHPTKEQLKEASLYLSQLLSEVVLKN